MPYFKKIEGERLYLSPISTEEAEKYTSWINTPNITDRLGNSSSVYSLESEKSALEKMANNGYNFAIVKSENNNLMGNISFFDINQISRRATLGLFIGDKENQNKGYGTEAIRLLLHYGFDTLNLNNVMLCTFSFNEQALRCYQKAGFKEIGRRRQSYFCKGQYWDEIYMDILAEELSIEC